MPDNNNTTKILEEHADHIIFDNSKKTKIYHPSKAEKPQIWPKNRDIVEVAGVQHEFFFTTFWELPEKARILDIGCGNGAFIKQINELYSRKEFLLSTITSTEVAEENIQHFNDITYSFVPDDLEWLKKNAGTCNVITDTYAALTYSDYPLYSMIFLILALEKGGTLFSISSMTINDLENSCFGNSGTRKAIQQFFKNHLGVKLEFSLVDIESKACAPGTAMKDLKIIAKVPSKGLKLSSDYQGLTPVELFSVLRKLVDQEIGIAEKSLQKDTDFKAGAYRITPRVYKRSNGKEWEIIPAEITESIPENFEIFTPRYAKDLFTEHFKSFQQSEELTSMMLKHTEWHDEEICIFYVIALYRLITRRNMTSEMAEKELVGLDASHADYIARGLTRKEVCALTEGALVFEGKNMQLEALCEFKCKGLTAQHLKPTLNWFKDESQFILLAKLIEKDKLHPGIAMTRLLQQKDAKNLCDEARHPNKRYYGRLNFTKINGHGICPDYIEKCVRAHHKDEDPKLVEEKIEETINDVLEANAAYYVSRHK